MNDSQISGNRRGQRAQRGVSLIEVLVVLVILVTGILTIIRLFPSGFFSIQSTGNAALADSMGAAAIGSGAQNSSSLPDAILPDNPGTDDLISASMNAAAYSNYDPDDPNNLENARVVSNETITVPSVTTSLIGGQQVKQSVYVVKYGPVVTPTSVAATQMDASGNVIELPKCLSVNSTNWTALSGSYVSAPTNGTVAPSDLPQDTLVPGQEKFLVDLANKRIAVPYAPYTLNTSTSPATSASYDQRMIVAITGSDGNVYTQYLDVPPGTPQDSAHPYAPKDGNNPQGYLPDTATNYQGGWFDPTQADSAAFPPSYDYPDPSESIPHQAVPLNVNWVSVTVYRPYNEVVAPTVFSNDPYEFMLLAGNIGTANPGAVGFNPKAAVGSGALARKAQISYITSSWQILHEDEDIPALTGTGSTFVVRTTVPNLLLAGAANPDNTINPGLADSGNSIVILDLDTGQVIAPGGATDPTNPDSPMNNEDVNGTNTSPSLINVSYALGRLTFGSNAFGDNAAADGSKTAPAHRIRIFYAADLNWTVAVQKAPSYFSELATSPADSAVGTTALAADQFAYDQADAFVYFARCNAGKTVEIDGSYTQSNGPSGSFSDTVSIDPILYAVGDSAVRVDLTDGTKFENVVPAGATVTFHAVRGLSARAVVAWKERNLWKEHSVDAVLNRTP